MHELLKLVISFCLTCICAELVSLMTDAGWARRCIKAASGLYILVVLLSSFNGVSSELALLEIPQQAQPDFKNESELFLLADAELELEQKLVEQCSLQFGVEIDLWINLQKSQDGDVLAQSKIMFPDNTQDAVRDQILAWLEGELGTMPDRKGES